MFFRQVAIGQCIALLCAPSAHATVADDIRQTITRTAQKVAATQRTAFREWDADSDPQRRRQTLQRAFEATTQHYQIAFDDVADQAKQLETKRDQLQREKDDLQRQKDALQLQEESLETRERLFATGFYGSLGAIVIGVVGVLVRRRLVTLEVKLKELQIEEKERAVARLRDAERATSLGMDRQP